MTDQFAPPPQGEEEAIELELYDWKIQNYKSKDGFGLSADIPLRFSAEAAELLILSQKTGTKIVIEARVVESEAGDLQA